MLSWKPLLIFKTFQVLLSVISTSLLDSTLSNGDVPKEATLKDALKDSKVVKHAEVWAVVSEALDSFLFPESKPPQVIKA